MKTRGLGDVAVCGDGHSRPRRPLHSSGRPFSRARLYPAHVAPLIVLAVATLLARIAGRLGVPPLRDWAAATRIGLAVMFCFTAAAHFNSMRADLVRMVPPGVPNPEFMVTLTGVCEILGAIGLLVPRTRRAAAIALIVLLVAVLPANIYAARSGVTLRGAPATPVVPRIALQVLFLVLIWWAAVRRRSRSA